MSDNNQDEFQTALAAEFDLPPDTDDTTPPAPATASDEDGGEKPPKVELEGEQPVPPVAEGEKPKPSESADLQNDEQSKQETAEEKANRETKEAANTEPPKPLTAEDIQAAIRADRTETQGRVEQIHSVREEIVGKLYPEGIDKNIYDTDNKVIKTAQDIVDRGLMNERTKEPYTYEEAASFILDANRQMAQNIEELNSWAETVAEQNISLIESNQRVISQWGEILNAMPDLAKELADEYINTQLEFDKTGSYITRMGMLPEKYYSRIMAPYKKLGEALANQQATQQTTQAQQEQQLKAEKQQKQQDEQAERNGLPPQRGNSSTKANTGDPMLDALVDELNKG